MSKTIQQLLDGVTPTGVNALPYKRRKERVPLVLDGMKAKRAPAEEGDHLFTPEELLTLSVDEQRVNGRVLGYQRGKELPHVRKIDRHLRDGKPVPTLEIALDGRGRMWVVDGQQRALAGVMARVPLRGVVVRRDKQEQAELFASQGKAKRLDRSTIILAGGGAFDRYIQEAVSSDRHAWAGIVSANRTSRTRIAPNAMFGLLVRYVANAEGQGAGMAVTALDARWDRGLADQLAPLIRCFGNKQTHPLAFRPVPLQAIGGTAMWVFRRQEDTDFDRWMAHMPKFPFDLWPHLRRQREFTTALLDHWNKGLRGSRRINRPAA